MIAQEMVEMEYLTTLDLAALVRDLQDCCFGANAKPSVVTPAE